MFLDRVRRPAPQTLALALLIASVAWAGLPAVRAQSMPSTPDAIRFLEQATFGPTKAEIAHVKAVGFETYLNEQFAAPVSDYYFLPYYAFSYRGAKVRFFQNALQTSLYPTNAGGQPDYAQPPTAASDQLRQRVAFTLNQIVVASALEFSAEQQIPATVGYQNVILKNTFGSYRQLLRDMTLNPTMGLYLNMVDNKKRTTTYAPNENYARELLQLFSVGVFLLNPDGTLQLDQSGNPIATYDNDDVTEVADALTGWTYSPKFGRSATAASYPANFDKPMVAYAPNHDTTTKTFLGVTLPANQTPVQDVDSVINALMNHQNTAPFVSKQLIQHLVTADPSPAYVGRIAGVFNNANNPQGKGDLRAVVRAILLDPEARGDNKADPVASNPADQRSYGHYREPALFIANLLRLLDAQGNLRSSDDTNSVHGWSRRAGQDILTPSSVFNFYLPDFKLSVTSTTGGATTTAQYLAPEAQLLNTESALVRINFVYSLLYSYNTQVAGAPAGTLSGTAIPGVTQIDLSEYVAAAAQSTSSTNLLRNEALLNLINERMLHGTMGGTVGVSGTTLTGSGMRHEISKALNTLTSTDTLARTKMALYLAACSSQYQVQR